MRKYRKQIFSVLSCLAVLSILILFPFSEAKCEVRQSDESIVHQVVRHLKDKQVELGGEDLKGFARTIWRESQSRKVDYRLVLALIEVESSFRHDAVSRDGSRGLMQLKPATAQEISRETDMSYKGSSDLFIPKKNIRIGVYFLSKLIEEFKNVRTALYAYNVGPNRAKSRMARVKKEPNSPFTKRVMQAFNNNISVLPAF